MPTKPKRPRGRPKGPTAPRTETAVLVRMTHAERAVMAAKAAAAGMPLSAWLRARGLEAVRACAPNVE